LDLGICIFPLGGIHPYYRAIQPPLPTYTLIRMNLSWYFRPIYTPARLAAAAAAVLSLSTKQHAHIGREPALRLHPTVSVPTRHYSIALPEPVLVTPPPPPLPGASFVDGCNLYGARRTYPPRTEHPPTNHSQSSCLYTWMQTAHSPSVSSTTDQLLIEGYRGYVRDNDYHRYM
jgi:hypothetical protein